jgi:hypothetical protein
MCARAPRERRTSENSVMAKFAEGPTLPRAIHSGDEHGFFGASVHSDPLPPARRRHRRGRQHARTRRSARATGEEWCHDRSPAASLDPAMRPALRCEDWREDFRERLFYALG